MTTIGDTQKVPDILKLAWARLLLHGRETTGVWLRKRGHWATTHGGIATDQQRQDLIRQKALTIGIDFDKSGVPIVEKRFSDTAIGEIITTLGMLILNNGETFLLGSVNDDTAYTTRAARELLGIDESEAASLARRLWSTQDVGRAL